MAPPEREVSVAALRLSAPVVSKGAAELYYGRNGLHQIETKLTTPDGKDKDGKKVKGGTEKKNFLFTEFADFLAANNFTETEREVI